jgi:hypothetical protein
MDEAMRPFSSAAPHPSRGGEAVRLRLRLAVIYGVLLYAVHAKPEHHYGNTPITQSR